MFVFYILVPLIVGVLNFALGLHHKLVQRWPSLLAILPLSILFFVRLLPCFDDPQQRLLSFVCVLGCIGVGVGCYFLAAKSIIWWESQP